MNRAPRNRSKASGLTAWVPRLTIAVAALHILVAAVEYAGHWRDFAAEGLWNTVADDNDARMAAMWFTLSGVGLLGIGLLQRRAVLSTGALPPETGWILLALGVPISLLEPVSGGWAVIILGVLGLVATRHSDPRPVTDRAMARIDAD